MKSQQQESSPFFILITLLIIVSSCSINNIKEGDHTPNIILMLADDQGWGDLSMNGNEDLNTPNIDNLAMSGATFNKFFVSPVCSPTRAEILTGRYHVRGGVYSTSQGGERLDLDETTIAEIFKENGYSTAAYGKWHNGMQYPYHPNARGFDDFYGFCSGHWGNYFDPVLEHNGRIVKGNGYLTDDLTDHALEFIEENKEKPFFLFLPFNTPHSPMQVPDIWWDKMKSKIFTMSHSNKNKEDTIHTTAAYAMCENIDWNVGRIMDRIKHLQLEENTIIIYMSDNGPNGWRWNGGLKGIKGHTDEGGVRSPFVIKWKGVIDAGKTINKIAGAIDILPTLTSLSNISFTSKKPLDGKDLQPLLIDDSIAWEDRYIVSHWRKNVSVRNQRFRLDQNDLLFDLENDPGQLKDVSLKFPEIHHEMMLYKNKWKQNVMVELLEEDNRSIPVGHPDCSFTQLPARDAISHGNIKRSNRWPNCSFFTNWTSIYDSITWDIEVLQKGYYKAIIYYTCRNEDVGSHIELSFGDQSTNQSILKAHDPPLQGAEHDRIERQESYVKDFVPINIGNIFLEKGKGSLVLKANEIKGDYVIDFRMMMLERVDKKY